jgi:hypothetical protein
LAAHFGLHVAWQLEQRCLVYVPAANPALKNLGIGRLAALRRRIGDNSGIKATVT